MITGCLSNEAQGTWISRDTTKVSNHEGNLGKKEKKEKKVKEDIQAKPSVWRDPCLTSMGSDMFWRHSVLSRRFSSFSSPENTPIRRFSGSKPSIKSPRTLWRTLSRICFAISLSCLIFYSIKTDIRNINALIRCIKSVKGIIKRIKRIKSGIHYDKLSQIRQNKWKNVGHNFSLHLCRSDFGGL